MLQLLLERGQSYEDLASVLGVDEAGVRGRARAALTELAGVDPDRNVGLTDYLLGQADPIGRADAVRHLKDDPADLELATELSQKLRLVAPQAELPRLPGEERRPKPRAEGGVAARLGIPDRLRGGRGAKDKPGAAPAEKSTRLGAMKGHRTRLIVAVGCLAVLVVVGILAATGAFKGGSSSAATTATTTTPAGTAGKAEGYPLAPLKVSSSGSAESRVPIPSTLQNLIPRVQAIYVTLGDGRELAAAVSQAVKSRQLILPVTGSPAFVGVAGDRKGNTIPVDLNALKGVRGSGSATLDLTNSKSPVLDVKLTDAEAPPKGQVYVVWFVFGLSK
jgi:hypothetical protein